MRFQLQARTGHPDFLDLPWQEPLEDWDHERLVEVPTGLHRHVVRAVRYDDRTYFLKALPPRLADREWRFLRHLRQEDVPVVDVVGVVRERHAPDGAPLPSILVTAQLEYALPYRLLFVREDAERLRDPMLDALVDLLVRIHLVGFHWGDCSLSNTLFRRDAHRLAAYLVDTETGELHTSGLTDGQRKHDIDLAVERISGELYDLMAAEVLPTDVDVLELGDELRSRYTALWEELTRDEVFGEDERYRIHERLQRINELGYDVEEVEIAGDDADGYRLRLQTSVLEPGRHQRRLRDLTGLTVQENQARSLLNDVASFGAWLREAEGVPYSEEYVAHRWLEHSFGGVLDRVPEEVRGKRDPAQIFHEALRFWWACCDEADHEVDLFSATERYVEEVLRPAPEERTVAVTSEREAQLLSEDPATE